MKHILLSGCLALAACTPTIPVANNTDAPISSSIPGVGTVCAAIGDPSGFDTALRAYDVARAAVNSLIDFKVIKPGTPTALKIADANDRVLAGFALAETARSACNATSYIAALDKARAAISEIQVLLPRRTTP